VGRKSNRGLFIWWIISSPIHLRLYQGSCIGPIYSLASSLEHLEDISYRAELLRVFSVPAERDPSSWGFGTPYGTDLFLYWSSWCIQPLEACSLLIGAFCSSSYYVYWIHLLIIPDRPHSCIRFLLIILIKVRSLLLVPYLVYLVFPLIISSDLCVITEYKP
jgi:hypothetical protein